VQRIQWESGGQDGIQPAAGFASWRAVWTGVTCSHCSFDRRCLSFCEGPGIRRLIHSQLQKEGMLIKLPFFHPLYGPLQIQQKASTAELKILSSQAGEHLIPTSCWAWRETCKRPE